MRTSALDGLMLATLRLDRAAVIGRSPQPPVAEVVARGSHGPHEVFRRPARPRGVITAALSSQRRAMAMVRDHHVDEGAVERLGVFEHGGVRSGSTDRSERRLDRRLLGRVYGASA